MRSKVFVVALLLLAFSLHAQDARVERILREVPLIDGVDAIQLPGDPERKVLAQRQAAGIPLDDGNWKALLDLAAQQNVKVPAVK